MAAGPAVSPAALELYRSCEVVDLHVETFVWTRIFGYDLTRRHGPGPTGARWFGQADLPRLAAGGLSTVVLSIATNPLRRAQSPPAPAARSGPRTRRPRSGTEALLANIGRLDDLVTRWRSASGSSMAVHLAVQGANAFDRPEDVRLVPAGTLARVTLMHLTDSRLGATSSPLGRSRGRGGLTAEGRAMVEALGEAGILVDLAHASKRTFADALAVHSPGRPPVVTHTGVSAVRPSWRNLDDGQIRAIADRGGVVGIMYHRGFLGRPSRRVGAEAVVRHLEHVIAVGGEATAALGSDWDGLIVTPRDMPTALDLPVLVDRMLARHWP
ncbi:MAG TPA: membrane dipeptidase, partial [Acidimicrobiia bacterium]|nr:membrane dipeptidase [Acidimicrobiia bacterium]